MYLKLLILFNSLNQFQRKYVDTGRMETKQNLESSQQMCLSFYSGSVGSFIEDPKYETYPEIEYMLTGGRGKT